MPHHFFLVPGVGAQGGDLQTVCKHAFNETCGLLVNVSRSILYADSGENFHHYSQQASLAIQKEMEAILKDKNLI